MWVALRPKDRSRMFCSKPLGSATAVGSSQRVPIVSISDAGCLDTTQWNYVKDSVTRFAAKVELMFRNPSCVESA